MRRAATRRSQALLLALLGSASFCAHAAHAFDATWRAAPTTSNWNASGNWSPDNVPDGTATFGASTRTSLTFSSPTTSIGTIQFNAAAPAYTFNLTSGNDALNVNGIGIVNNSSNAPTFNVGSLPFSSSTNVLNFSNASTAGNANINIAFPAAVNFLNTSTAGSSVITNTFGNLSFQNSSTAGNATISNLFGFLDFRNSSSAATATIGNSGDMTFHDASTAANATITTSSTLVFADSSTASSAAITITADTTAHLQFSNSSTAANATIVINGDTNFADTSTAGNAIITNNLILFFQNSATAGNATITTNSGAFTQFFDTSTGGVARFITNAGGTFDISGLTAAGMTAGSIEGLGAYLLGAKTLTVGANNLSTEVGGVISGDGGALVKVGGGTLTLSGTNTYTGGTTINAGTLALGTDTRTGKIVGAVTNNATFYVINADTSGLTTILNNQFMRFFNTTNAGTATITNNLTVDFVDSASAANATITNVGLNSLLRFFNTSTAGNATIANGGFVQFTETATAGNATFTNNQSINFFNTSTAGAATFINATNGFLTFQDSSSAGTATINNSGNLSFIGSTTAASAKITNAANAATSFFGASTAANATIANSGFLYFYGTSTAANATITNNYSAQFNENATAGNATITNNSFLFFYDSSTAGAATITTNNGATTLFSDNSTAGSAQLITAAGGVTDFSSTVGPNGDNKITAGSIAGAGNYYLGGVQLTVGANNMSTTVSGTISDCGPTGQECDGGPATGGSLIKVGSGTLTLTGVNTYTGPTAVNGGVLDVNGSLVSIVTVNSSGTLKGNGAIGGLTVTNGGTVAPGNSIGTLTVNGNVMFGAGSIYQVEANAAGASDKIVATGKATLSGGTVQVIAAPGTYSAATKYTILTANGGVTGTFSGLTESLAFLTASLSYDANDVFLTLSRNATAFSSVAQTYNQRAVAGALDAGPFGSALAQAVLPLTAPQALQAFDALSGEIHGSTQTALIEDSRYVRSAVLGRLRSASYMGASADMAPLAFGAAQTVSLAPTAIETAAPAEALAYGLPVKAPIYKAPALYDPNWTFWAQGYGAWGRWDSDGNAAAMRRDLGGFVTGLDRRVGDVWRVGIAAGYARDDITVSDRASTAGVDTLNVAAYAGARVGLWSLRSGAAFAWHDIDTSRSILFPGFFEIAKADYHASTSQVFGEVGYGMAWRGIAVEPIAGLAFVHLNTGSFTETGTVGTAPLAGAGNTQDVGYSTLGVRLATTYMLGNGMVLVPRAMVAWEHALGGITPDAALAFQSTAASFNIHGVPLARDTALVEAGFDVALARGITLGVAYTGALANAVQDHAVKGKFAWTF